jgi:prophage antirepressor-like protein
MQKNQIQVFKNTEFGELEVMTIGGKTYFPATECAEALGYADPRKAVNTHCKKDGWAKRPVTDNLGRKQEKKYINEGKAVILDCVWTVSLDFVFEKILRYHVR